MPPVSVERRLSADDEELFRLYHDVFGASLTETSRRRWRWQYIENPHTGPDGPEIWVAKEGDAVLGQYASMPVRLQWGGDERRSSWGMDVFLKPEARGRGVGALLFTTWSDHVDVALGLGLTPSSYGLFKKLGYRDVGPVPFFRKILDPVAVAKRRLGRVPGAVMGALLRIGLRLAIPVRPAPEGVAVRTITRFGDEYDRLWARCKDAYAMCVRRDRAYLEWKYARCPNRSYIIHEASREGRLAGFAVSRHEDYRGLRLGWILDVFAHPSDRSAKDALIAGVLDGFESNGVARAQAFAMNGPLAADLRRFGFFRGHSPMQFCVRARVPSEAVFADPQAWHVVFGDSDMDR